MAALSIPLSAGAVVYDARADFSFTNNPNGVWSYGNKSDGLTFALNTVQMQPADYYNLETWASTTSPDPYPLIARNNSGATVTNFGTAPLANGDMVIHPGDGTERTTVRFIAPFTGTYTYSAVFDGLMGATSTVYVVANGASIGTGILNPTSSNVQSFNGALLLTAGTTLDFEADNLGDKNNDGIRFNATIDATPVPGPGAGLALAVGFLGYVRRRRAR